MRIAVVAGPDPGHAFPSLALAGALARRGHDVVVATGSAWAGAARGEGCGFVAIPQLAADPRDVEFGFRLWGRGREMAPLLAEALSEFGPEAVVADTLTVPGWFAADLLGVPRVELVPHLLQLPSRALPPPGLAVLPGRWPVSRLRDAVLRRTYARSAARARQECARARQALGLPPTGPPVARLVATLPALEIPRPDWPDDTYVVGPLVWEPPGDPLPEPAGDGPLVLVSDSTATGGRVGLLDLALDVLPPAGFRVVGTRFGPPPQRLPQGAVVGSGPQDPILRRAAAVVSPGGHGLLGKALRLGVPMVVVPGPGDQAMNGVRVEWAGCGVVVPPPRLSAARLLNAVRRVTTDQRLRAGAQRAAASAEGLGADHAAALVEQVLAR